MNGYAAKVPFYNADDLTMREVQNVFQLDPEPPQMELNDYIREAVRKRDLSYFSFFLHHFEKRLNGVIYNNSGKSRAEVVSEFAAQSGYKDESGSADELLSIAQRNRSIVSLYRMEQDEDGEEPARM